MKEFKFKKMGLNLIEWPLNEIVPIKLQSIKEFPTKKWGVLDLMTMINLTTGEEIHAFRDGGFEGRMKALGVKEGDEFGVRFTGKKEFEVNGNLVNVNQYEFFTMETTDGKTETRQTTTTQS